MLISSVFPRIENFKGAAAMLLRSVSVQTRLVASFGVIFLLSLLLAGASLYFLHSVNDIGREMRDDHLPNTEMLGKIQVLALRQRVSAAGV